ncbi:MAG TPA: IS630 family transposase [Pyrinomonadaceae bacterium]|nr:IS630 family transposase [Pyrinomonadaceae bacterium]
MDETTLTLDPPLRACWMKVGQQKRIPATRPGIKQKRHVFGGYNWVKDTVTWTMAETKNSSHFIRFLEHLLVKKHPTGRVVLVMDNASYHKSAPALAALSLFEHRVLVIWLPTYCSDLNPIERFWRHLKDLACANKLQDSIEEVVNAAERILTAQNMPESSLCFHVYKNL